jgi:sulfate transport system permease protein
VQPVLEELDHETEQAASTLGATRWQTFRWVILPVLVPPLLTGFTLAFARAIGEYGSVVFISSNVPFRDEIAPVLIVTRLEEYAYREAAAIATLLLGMSFLLLMIINRLERWSQPGSSRRTTQAITERFNQWLFRPISQTLLSWLPRSSVSPDWGDRIARAMPKLLIRSTFLILIVLVIIPLVNVFAQALDRGIGYYWSSLTDDPDTLHAIFLTLIIAPLAVILNTMFGFAAAYTIARFRFPGRTILTTLIDLPFSVSPVVAGLVFVLLFGLHAPLGAWFKSLGYQVIFAPPGLVLVTMFVTFPFVARELLPVLEANGPEEEIAARSLGANAWQMLTRVTLPNIKWGLIYGMILCNARAMGEFGAIYVVSGRISGRTDTMPLRVEKLFQEYNQPAAFALASVLTMLALVTLAIKVTIEQRMRAEMEAKSTVSAPE